MPFSSSGNMTSCPTIRSSTHLLMQASCLGLATDFDFTTDLGIAVGLGGSTCSGRSVGTLGIGKGAIAGLLAMLGGFGWPIITRLPMIIGSFPAAFGTLAVLVLIPPLVIALVHRRFDWLTAIGGVAILASVPLRRLIGESQAWHDFARAVIA